MNTGVLSNFRLNKTQKILFIALIVLSVGLLCTQPFFADSPFATVLAALQSVYSEIRTLSTGVALVAAVIALLFRMFSSNKQTQAQSTSWLIGIVIAWVSIQLLGTILTWLQGMFETTDPDFGNI